MNAAIVLAAVIAGGFTFAAGLAFALWLTRSITSPPPAGAAWHPIPKPTQQPPTNGQADDERPDLVDRITAEIAWLEQLDEKDLKETTEYRGVEWNEKKGEDRKRLIATVAYRKFHHGALRL